MNPLRNVDDDSLGRRIKEIRQARGLTQKEFADSLGIVQGFLSSIERGRKTPSDTLLIALRRTYGVNAEWLRTGRGEMGGPEMKGEGPGAGRTPLLAKVGREFPGKIGESDILSHVSLPDVPAGSFAVVNYGDFMAPTVRDGDLVFFKPGASVENGAIVLVTNRWGDAILRRYREKDGEVFYSPDNGTYSPFRPDPETRVIGTVVQVWRRVKL